MNHILTSTSVLEFGPYVRPTILPGDKVDYTVADCVDEVSLRSYAEANGDDSDAILPIDVMVDPLSVNVPESLIGRFDLLIANHVFEHLIDPFRWLDSWSKALVDGGKIVLCIPDKKYSFDKFRADTTFAHFVTDFLEGGSRSLSEHLIDCAINYDSKSKDAKAELKKRLTQEFISNSLNEYQPGLHVHVFQYERFIPEVLKPFLQLQYLDFELYEHGALETIGEFYVVLKKSKAKELEFDSKWIFSPAADTFSN
jgi:SAM-dependent methyltransferase